jgi:hypothetical protein
MRVPSALVVRVTDLVATAPVLDELELDELELDELDELELDELTAPVLELLEELELDELELELELAVGVPAVGRSK